MFRILPCGVCKQALSLAPTVSDQATVECPNCEGQFVVSEVLASLGTWRVIEDPGSALASTEAPECQSEVAPHDGSEVTSSELSLAEQEPSKPTKPKTDWSDFKPITHEQYERMKRKTRSPIWAFLQVVLGGLAAIPISLLLLWHVLDTDIAGAGYAVGEYVPWIVPEKYRPNPMASAGEGDSDNASVPEWNGGDSGFRDFGEIESDAGTKPVDPNSAGLPAEGSEAVDPASAELKSMSRSDAAANAEPTGSMAPNNTVAEVTRLNEAGRKNIFELIQACERDLDQWHLAVKDSGSDLKVHAQRVYSDLVDLAAVIGTLPSNNPVLRNIRDAMQPIGKDVKRHPDVQNVIKQGAQFWASQYSDAQDAPLALVVEIASAAEVDGKWEIEPLAGALPGAIAQVQIPSYLAPSLIPGQRLLLLGSLEGQESSGGSAPNVGVFTACYLHAL